MDIFQASISAFEKLQRRWYYAKAKRIYNKNLARWNRMTPEQQEAQRLVFLEFTRQAVDASNKYLEGLIEQSSRTTHSE